jgi:hypothetical protein
VGTGQQWAEQQWARDRWAEQRSWRETYADPGAATTGAPRQAGPSAELPAPRTGPDDATAGAPRATRASRRSRRNRPDLTVITGEGSPGEWEESPYLAPLRAVPGEPYERT